MIERAAKMADWLRGTYGFSPEMNAKCVQLIKDMVEEMERLKAERDAAKQWISVKERLPMEFMSVLAHMTDAGEFPSVREAYVACGRFFFPALHEHHPVDYWMEMPEAPKGEQHEK